MYLILVDSFSGWFEMNTLSDLSSKYVVTKIKQHFAVHCIPSKLLKDNVHNLQVGNSKALPANGVVNVLLAALT